MATIIIQGNRNETNKTLSALEKTFYAVNKKASVRTATGINTIVDVTFEYYHKEKYTDEEIDKGCLCCCSAVRNCAECPFRNEDDCFLLMFTLYHNYVNRLSEQNK